MTTFSVCSERDLDVAVSNLIENNFQDIFDIEFVGWPRFELILRGDDFHGGIPSRLIPSLMKMQNLLYKAYASVKYGDPNKKLSLSEKDALEVTFCLSNKHSTFVEGDASRVLKIVLMEALKKMTGKQAIVTALGLAAIIGGTWCGLNYLEVLSKRDDHQHEIKMTELENQRFANFQKLASYEPRLEEYRSRSNEVLLEVLKRLRHQDQLILGEGQEVAVDGRTAQKLVATSPAVKVEDRLDGIFRILSVDSGLREDGLKLKVLHVEDNEKLSVTIPEGTLDAAQEKLLQGAEWHKKNVHMRVNVTKYQGKIKSATLIKAGLEPERKRHLVPQM